MRKIAFSGLAATVLSLAVVGSANAVTVAIYHTQAGAAAAAADATVAQAGVLGTPDAIATVGGINFTDAPGFNSNVTTIAQFLNNPAGLNSAVGNLTLNNTYMLFTGSIFLDAGSNLFTITHDDGLQLIIGGGVTPNPVVNQPLPTSPVATPFTATAPSAGLYNFQLAYGETAGGPAELIWNFKGAPVGGGVPEPASWALMIGGFGLAGSCLRRRQIALR